MIEPARVSVVGPLTPFVEGFHERLIEDGYSPGSAVTHLRLLAHVSGWLADEGLDVTGLTPRVAERFLLARRRDGYATKLTMRSLRPLLGYLRELAVLPEDDRVPTAVEQLVAAYRDYLLRERGLAAGSVRLYGSVAQLFLSERSEPIADDLADLSAVEVNAFLLRESARRGPASANTVVCVLRSLLGFFHVQGWTARSLASAVPSVARRHQSLPRGLAAGEVARLLESCDRATALGSRDYAILILLARLGLRASEVAALELDDLDWRAGELLIRGKGPRLERLPLPHDVGEAIADYLRRGRPVASCRQLFLRSAAPLVGLTRAGPTSVVRAACERAGLPAVGAHRLRHSLATDLLQRGAPLAEIGQLLRHKSLFATSIYAKVDRVALSSLALPWPGSVA